MKPFPDFDTPAGIRHVAEHLDSLAEKPQPDDRHTVGHLRINADPASLSRAAAMLRSKALHASRKKRDAWQTPLFNHPLSGVPAMDAVRVCGSPEAALATILRQIDTQGESMDPGDVKRALRGVKLLEEHIASEARKAELDALDAATDDRIAAGRQPDKDEIIPEGTEVHVHTGYRNYLGTVSECRIGPHPILGKKHPAALYTVNLTHIRETKSGRYAFHRMKCRKMGKLIWRDIKLLTD